MLNVFMITYTITSFRLSKLHTNCRDSIEEQFAVVCTVDVHLNLFDLNLKDLELKTQVTVQSSIRKMLRMSPRYH